jgi:hypothetical protein
MNAQATQTSGVGIGGLLLVLFIGLKLGNVIDWNWWWVMAPLWIPLALAGAILLIGWIIIGIANLLESAPEKKARKAQASLRKYRQSLA